MKYLVNLKDGTDVLVPEVFAGADTNNLLASSKVNNWVATEDCILFGRFSANLNAGVYLTIDGATIVSFNNPDNFSIYGVPVKEGQVITFGVFGGGAGHSETNDMKIYGLKY